MTETYFMTGTGTGIGKTYSTALVAEYAVKKNYKTAVLKPTQTGMKDPMNGDLGEIHRKVPGLMRIPTELACSYCLSFESSPHLAAELENIEISLDKIVRDYETVRDTFHPDVMLLESAGGIYVPLNQREIMADIPARLKIPAIVVADALLGTINHTVLTINELRRRLIEVRGVIVNNIPENADILVRDNLKMIEKFGRVEILAQIEKNGGIIDDLGLQHIF